MMEVKEMHKFLRAVGFSMCQSKKEIKEMLGVLLKETGEVLEFFRENEKLCQLSIELAPGMGICIVGEKNEDGSMEVEYYFPYLTGKEVTSTAECAIQKERLLQDF